MRVMHKFGRRDFLQSAAALLPLTAMTAKAAGSHHLKDIGVQLYTVRDVILKDPGEVLSAIQDDGYTEVEAIYSTLHAIWNPLQQTKMKPVSVHLDSALFDDSGKMQPALEHVHQWGFQYAVFPYLPQEQRGGVEAIKRLAGKLNKAGEQGQKLGLQVCYHNHAFEFEPVGGKPLLETLLAETDPKLVALELDVFWASVAGHDPAALIKQHSGRIALVHLKDKAKGFPVRYDEKVPKDTFKEVGNGSIDFPAVLRASAAAGVKHYFVEQDQTSGSPLDSLKMSYNYLHKISY
jgi:sugar phosphate isomerase/epimerase